MRFWSGSRMLTDWIVPIAPARGPGPATIGMLQASRCAVTSASGTGVIKHTRAVDALIASLRRDPQAPIFLEIDSCGGNPLPAMRCYEALRNHAAPIHTHCESRCYSA